MNTPALNRLIPFCILFVACTEKGIPAWVEKYPHAVSPNNKAVVYQVFTHQPEGMEVAVLTHFASRFTSGGGSIFNILLPEADTLNLTWTSDTSVTIQYPAHAIILKQEGTDYFLGRRIHFIYQAD
ncbi:MAG: hypothetical protein KDD14_20005 [Saprospiraceae bacterium]|nr:hypothetical protein [Saprospiraceae bacterium]